MRLVQACKNKWNPSHAQTPTSNVLTPKRVVWQMKTAAQGTNRIPLLAKPEFVLVSVIARHQALHLLHSRDCVCTTVPARIIPKQQRRRPAMTMPANIIITTMFTRASSC